MSEEKRENQPYPAENIQNSADITQETTPATPAPMPEWKPPEKYEVKQNSGYGMLLVIFCLVVIVVGYFLRQYADGQAQNGTTTPAPTTTTP